jgi:ABC-2 type transport system permease protein
MKFSNLFKKELSGLLTRQVIFSMIFMMIMFIFLGQVLGGAMSDITDSENFTSAHVANLDDSEFTKEVLERVKANGMTVTPVNLPADTSPEDYAKKLSDLDIKSLVIIPKGYGDSIIKDKKQGDIIFISSLSVGGMMSSLDSVASSSAVSAISTASADTELLTVYNVPEADIERIQAGAATVDYTAYNGKTAKVSAEALAVVIMLQMMIAPIVVFFLVSMASQMIMTAISTEKIDKTLETLLSTPVSRLSVLMSKMAAASVAAILNAVTMGIGMIFYIGGMTGAMVSSAIGGSDMSAITESMSEADMAAVTGAIMSIPEAMTTLGITLSIGEYLLFGLQLILSIAIGLAASLILGAMATDAKSQASLMLPIIMASMLPFFVTMFVNVNEMPIAFKFVMYAIPFTHAYMAVPNLIAGDMILFWCGVLYQAVFLAVTLFAAVKMFMSDRLFTVSFGENQTKKSLFGKK